MRKKLDEYLAMGVEHIWCFDPEAREGAAVYGDGL